MDFCVSGSGWWVGDRGCGLALDPGHDLQPWLQCSGTWLGKLRVIVICYEVKNWKGCHPFHEDHTLTLSINPQHHKTVHWRILATIVK